MLNFFTRFFYPKEIVVKKGSLQRLKFVKYENPLLIFSNSSEENGVVEKIKTMLPQVDLLKIKSGEFLTSKTPNSQTIKYRILW